MRRLILNSSNRKSKYGQYNSCTYIVVAHRLFTLEVAIVKEESLKLLLELVQVLCEEDLPLKQQLTDVIEEALRACSSVVRAPDS